MPDPTPGLLTSCAYLRHEQARRGLEEGSKDRPCVIVLSTVGHERGTVVTVAPISHCPPMEPNAAVELPA